MFSRRLLFFCFLFLASCNSTSTPHKQKIRLNLFCEPPTLDLRKASDSTSINVILNLFEGLTRIGLDGLPHLALAESVEISEDQCTYTFKLRSSFWSNGDPITAYDFIYAWESALDPLFPSEFAYKFNVIKNATAVNAKEKSLQELAIHAPDNKTLVVELEHPTPYFLELTAFPTFFPINHRIAKNHENWAAEAGPLFTSNGPFLLDKWDHENEIKLIRNPRYWDKDTVQLEEIDLVMVDDTTTELYMFEMGELDWAGSPLSNLPSEFLPALKREGKLRTYPAAAVYYYKVNTSKFPLNHQKLRQALALAINRQKIINHILQVDQQPALALVPPLPGWDSPQCCFVDEDVLTACKLFEEFLEEVSLEKQDLPPLTLCYNSNREHQKIAQAIQQQWTETLGIRVNLETYDWKVYLSKLGNLDYQIGRMGWVGDFNDPISFLDPFRYKDSKNGASMNQTGWESSLFCSLLDQAENNLDSKRRKDLLMEAEKVLINDMPIIPLYYIVCCYLKKPSIEGVFLSPLGMADFKHARWVL